MNKVIISADSTCDMGDTLKKQYNIHLFNSRIALEGQTYIDGETITPEDIYNAWHNNGALPKTSALTAADYEKRFKNWRKEGYEIVHLNLGSGISSSYQNCALLAQEMGGVYVVDSASLSTGFGLLVIKAAQFAQQGMNGKEIQENILKIRDKTHASFILDTLEFMRAGGRCSGVAAFGANLLKIKPEIQVNNQDSGKMSLGKKYRGKLEKVLPEYVKDQLSQVNNLDLAQIFITHSGSPKSDIDLVQEEIKKYADFKNVDVTRASCTISTHCGPRTLGILFMEK